MLKPLRFMTYSLLAVMGSGAIAACSSPTQQATDNQPVRITLVSYAVTQGAYEQIIPQFREYWQQKTGQDVIFEQSYGGSGSQTRAVIDGLEADVVALALAGDTKKIEKAGLIDKGWEKELPNDSIVHKSVVALVPRDQTIKLTSWEDLTRNDIQVITANPKTSGGAKWNFLALWGYIVQTGGTEANAEEFLSQVLQNVPVLPKDARESSDVFYKQGQGNVLINYENEVILAQQKGDKTPFIVPTDYNISIDNPVAVVDKNVDQNGNREVAEAFVQFLFTPVAQREFAKVGFRPINEEIAQEFASQYPEIKNLFTIKDLGGWEQIDQQFFEDGATFDKILSKVNNKK